MTDIEIADEFARIEKVANRTPQGADHQAILRTVAAKADRSLDEVRAIVRNNTFMGPN
ncbi:hypothetical protein [Pseudosulfitobacter pseudonitzschiae]|uniref:hypothetical protein n=1 Tax=Pseudosulfitobacter pseudonitzschiae TaxID=1402135 RepID=UPI001AFBFBB1|nr:hypothetical protein [Pseudosulfitobacter pseudonitzschiae]MBM1817191.1 hypothetical protein [Pseudosulfitobacter pseudonitzschiae]MBM1834202.1 hypothetical protein [Pseudosulfitobacter pseudonitzschiae]MBM1839067.1 hypothetical protein [Pseudosulfitobacter pseudonitzschiae]MBM1843915.1 hypothetical protein [Pseudosulfitobacter pseudonitzschiae]MBM1848752.1 hypothetical protein [Pseudosulfitobacter pseudonitzschiae]